MTNEQTNDITKDLAELGAQTFQNSVGEHLPALRKAVSKNFAYPIAFALIEVGTQFQYRSTKAVKVDKTHAVLIPSGKYVTIDKMKIVKVRG